MQRPALWSRIPQGAQLALILALVLVLILLSPAGDRSAVGMAGATLVAVWAFGVAQARLTEAQVKMAAVQTELSRSVNLLTFMPVLAGQWTAEPSTAQLQNVGTGPALDIHGVLYQVRELGRDGKVNADAQFETARAAALAAGAGAQITVSGNPSATHANYDIWLIHCADLNGKHHHAASNLGDRGMPQEPGDGSWRWFSEWQTSAWIRARCPRCAELARTQRELEAARQKVLSPVT